MAEPASGRPADTVAAERRGDLVLLRSPGEGAFPPQDVADLAAALRKAGDGALTVVAEPSAAASEALWPCLLGHLDAHPLPDGGLLRLALAGAGADAPGQQAPARALADRYGVTVEAPVAAVAVVPGGTLYAPAGDGGGGWRRFSGEGVRHVPGARRPAPGWQAALGQVPPHSAAGCVVEEIPAGLLVRPAAPPAAAVQDLCHAVPPDRERLTAVVLPGVPEEDLAALLAGLPAPARGRLRLAPGGPQDLLPLAQRLADRLGAEIEAATGLPLLTQGGAATRSVLIGPDGTPAWLPFADAAVCSPSVPGADRRPPRPRLLRCVPPVPVRAQPAWEVEVTRAGLRLAPAGADGLPGPGHPVGWEGPVIEVGEPGRPLDAALLPVLDGVLGALAGHLRRIAAVHVHGDAPDGGRALRDLAERHKLRGVTFPTPPGGGPVTAVPAIAPVPAVAVVSAIAPPAAVPPVHASAVAQLPARRDGSPAPAPVVPRRDGAAAVPAPARSGAGTPPAPVESGLSGVRGTAPGTAEPDLAAAWDELSRGRVIPASPRPLAPPPFPAGPDLDAAWKQLSRRRRGKR